MLCHFKSIFLLLKEAHGLWIQNAHEYKNRYKIAAIAYDTKSRSQNSLHTLRKYKLSFIHFLMRFHNASSRIGGKSLLGWLVGSLTEVPFCAEAWIIQEISQPCSSSFLASKKSYCKVLTECSGLYFSKSTSVVSLWKSLEVQESERTFLFVETPFPHEIFKIMTRTYRILGFRFNALWLSGHVFFAVTSLAEFQERWKKF